MSVTPLVIIGAGGFGREVHDLVEAINDEAVSRDGAPAFDVVGFLDDSPADVELIGERGLAVLGPVSHLEELPEEVQYVIAIGNGEVRRQLDTWASGLSRHSPVLVHPRAVIGKHLITMAPGAVVCAGAIITTNVRLGRHVHINLGVTVGHDAVLEDYVTVNPNVSVSGSAVIEESANLGTCSSVIQGRRVGARTVVGAGAVVARDLPSDVTAVGLPARPLQRQG